MPLALKNNNEHWTYADYLTWPDDERWEIIDGVAYAMTPAPTTAHQRILRNLAFAINVQLDGKDCELFLAPFDVRLSQNKQQSDNYIETVVQPDIIIVCDSSKIDDRGCNGAPELVIEILSPSTSKYDLSEKRYLYERHAVGEIWFVHPLDKMIMIFYLQENGKYGSPDVYGEEDTVVLKSVDGVEVDLRDVFTD
jgi:Uma2 family endonuclease